MKRFKRPVEAFFVASGDTAILADGTTKLATSTGGSNLSSGQLGVFHYGTNGIGAPYTALAPGDTVIDAPSIVIAQGTSDASNPGPNSEFAGVFNTPFKVSAPLYGSNIRAYRGQGYVVPTLNAWVIGADDGGAAEIGTPIDETLYQIRVTFKGWRRDNMNSTSNLDSFVASYTTPDYTALGTTNSTDDLIQNLVRQLNMNSAHVSTNGHRGRYPFIAFATRFEGGANAGFTSTLVSALDSLDGGVAISTYGITTDVESAAGNDDSVMGNTFALLAAGADDVDTSTQIISNDMDLAGTVAAGATGIIILALDESRAYEDREARTKVDLEVSLREGFAPSVGIYDATKANEGEGTYRQLSIKFKNTEGQREYPANQNRTTFPVISPTIPFSSATNYDVYAIEHGDLQEFVVSPNNTRLHMTIVCIPKGSTTTSASFEAVLNPWMASLPNPFPAITL